MLKTLINVIAVGLLAVLAVPAHADQLAPPRTFADFVYEVNDLTVDLFNQGQLLRVTGKVRNLSQAPVRGKMIVYLKDASEAVVHAFETEVNHGLAIAHGADGYFEIYENIQAFRGAKHVTVEFFKY